MGLLCSLLLLAACHSDDNEPLPADGETRTVTLTLNLPEAMTRSAVSPEEMPTRYLMQVIEDGTPGTVETLTGELTRTFSLYIDRNYEFLFWADQGDSYYTYTDLQNIQAATAANESMGIAYRGYYTWNGSDTSINLTLDFAVSKITLVNTTSPLYYGNTVSVTLDKAYTAISAKDGVKDPSAAYTYTQDITTTVDPDEDVATFYVMTKADEEQNITVTVNDTDVATVTATPSPGKYLKLSGNIGGASIVPQESLSITVSLGEWGDIAISLPDKLTDATVASAFLQGSGTDDDPYLIQSAADFKCYQNGNYEESYVRLETDIQITSAAWSPIGIDEGGTFDGGNHTISGTLTVNTQEVDFGLFGRIGGTVCNLTMDVDMTVTGNGTHSHIGSIAGSLIYGTIENCTNDGNIDASDTTSEYTHYTGGIVGEAISSSIKRCTNTGSVTEGKGGEVFVGGIAGFAQSTILENNAILENNVLDGNSPTTEVGNNEEYQY